MTQSTPFSPEPRTPSPSSPSSLRSWSPSSNDHLIFKWIKLEGKSQSWVATAFGVSQPTISRIIQRYERWQAHASEREGGRLDHTERLRAQRWLTYERNELLLNSCVRIAQEMEGFTQVSKETVSRSTIRCDDPANFRTETASVDRSGVAARFIRLAFRINMEQLKLASLDPAPPAQPLSTEELAALQNDALTTAQEFDDAQQRAAKQARQFSDAGWAAPAPFPTPETADSYKPDPFAWPVPRPTSSDSTSSTATPTAPASPPLNPQPQAQGSSQAYSEPATTNSPPSDISNLQSEISNPQSPISNPQSDIANSPPSHLEPHAFTPPTGEPANLVVSLSPTNSPTHHSPTHSPPIHPVNNLNSDSAPQIAATSTDTTNYEFPPAPEFFSPLNNDSPATIPLSILIPRIVEASGPEPPDSEAIQQLSANTLPCAKNPIV